MFIESPRRAFSLIELVIVVVIIGIIAAIAIPRMSRGAAGATDVRASRRRTGPRQKPPAPSTFGSEQKLRH